MSFSWAVIVRHALLLGLMFLTGMVQAALVWQPVPKKPGKPPSRMAPKPFVLNQAVEHAMLWKPDLQVKPIKPMRGQFPVRMTGMDNYHALVAEHRPDENTLESAVRYLYLRGKPSGNSPSRVTGAVKTPFDIMPAPLPREHRRYHANHDAVFVLRFEGKPLANTPITLSTANGSNLQLVSDRVGAVRFTLPDDFVETKPGRKNNRPAEFVLTSKIERNGRTYRTSLSAPYHVDPGHWQSFELGLMVLGVGFVSGLVVNRRLTANNKINSETNHRQKNKGEG